MTGGAECVVGQNTNTDDLVAIYTAPETETKPAAAAGSGQNFFSKNKYFIAGGVAVAIVGIAIFFFFSRSRRRPMGRRTISMLSFEECEEIGEEIGRILAEFEFFIFLEILTSTVI